MKARFSEKYPATQPQLFCLKTLTFGQVGKIVISAFSAAKSFVFASWLLGVYSL